MKKIEDKFGKDGAKLHNMQLKDFTNFYNSLFDQMKPALNKTTGSALMKDYSPWLQNFQANQYSELIEIPGIVTIHHTVVCYILCILYRSRCIVVITFLLDNGCFLFVVVV